MAHITRLLERLQAEYPGIYPNQLLRTCQRRLKEWRRDAALQLVFGTTPADVISLGSTNECPAPTGENDRHGDLPLRLDDAAASPTTPQGPQHRKVSLKNEKVAGVCESDGILRHRQTAVRPAVNGGRRDAEAIGKQALAQPECLQRGA